MKIRALAVAALLCGCNQQVATYSAASGSLALSHDDGLLYAVDTDSDQLFVIDAKTEEVKASVHVGKHPEKVIVGRDDTIFVANRLDRSISVIKKGEWSEVTRLPTAVEPTGMAITGDTLLVVNATMLNDAAVGSLMAFDLKSMTMVWEVPVGHEPRALAVTGNRALVSLYKDGDVVAIDLGSHQVVNAKTDTYEKLNRNVLQNNVGGSGGFSGGGFEPSPDGRFFGPAKVQPRGIEALTVSPDGTQVFASTLLSSDQVLPATATETVTNIGIGGGDGYGGSTCGSGSVTTPAILTFDSEGRSMATDVSGCEGQRMEGQPAQVLSSGNPTMPIQGPAASVVDPTGAFLFVVNRESNNVAILPTNAASVEQNNDGTLVKGGGVPVDVGGSGSFFSGQGSVHTTVSVGAGPSGIALSRDGKTAWVLNAFDHSISRLERKDGIVQATHTARFTDDVLPQDVVEGRKLFFSAADSRMSSQQTGISCASCHLEGREDGHIWNFTDGPRQTPSLAGRMLAKTAPFHWNGEFEGLTQFMATTVNHRMGGVGVSLAMERQIAAFIDAQPAADNPHATATLNAQQLRGQTAYVKAQCNTCHKGEALTDNSFVDVGTFVKGGTLPDDLTRFARGGLNTPSLLGIARSAPYLHDGSIQTLKERILVGKDGDLHGKTSQLSAAEVDDLVEYLKTL